MPLRKYDEETRARAVRLFRDRRRDKPDESVSEGCRRIGELVGVNPETLRTWVNRDTLDRGERAGVPAGECQVLCVTGVN
jgi:transposase-like protein